jgi:hypothetical protein
LAEICNDVGASLPNHCKPHPNYCKLHCNLKQITANLTPHMEMDPNHSKKVNPSPKCLWSALCLCALNIGTPAFLVHFTYNRVAFFCFCVQCLCGGSGCRRSVL